MLTPPSFGERLKSGVHIVHIVHKCLRLVMATWPHGHMVMANERAGCVDIAHIAPH